MTAEVKLFGGAVWTVRDGQITRAFFYTDREDALDDWAWRGVGSPRLYSTTNEVRKPRAQPPLSTRALSSVRFLDERRLISSHRASS